MADDVIAGCLVAHGGAVVSPRIRELLAKATGGGGAAQPAGVGA
jgi:hypothetical protein